ncbi:MAG: hypothetical protein SOR77_03620 [Peptoniphilus sp.]|uniref:hypothetical protein n=1 Tax=Peptoniphilus sp. TaxID=1971214 RepID=UPI002A74B27E|nr:hypothetical protein [Peptoniphilus sp.]MDY2986705.1 hypothetical protein [Peptoniphilus sp.]
MREKSDLLDRYINQMVKYLSYENSITATNDLNEIIESELGEDYTYEELEAFLLTLGSPYNFSTKYEVKQNILISGKNYEIFFKYLKIMALEIILATIIYKFIGGFENKTGIINSVKILLLTVFITGVLSSFISERVKNIRMMSSLVKDFSIEELYYSKERYTKNNGEYLFMCVFSLFIFLSIIYASLSSEEALTKALQIIFFMLVLRDISRISEVYYGKFITTLSVITDVGALILLSTILKMYFYETQLRIVYYLLILTIAFDLVSTLIKLKRSMKISNNKNKSKRR